MIEVEKKFQPTDEQLASLLKDAQFLGEKINHDVGYDYPDYRLLKKEIRLRNRNGSFELKISKHKEASEVSHEIENKKEIERYFNTDNFEKFVKDNLVIIVEIKTKRKKYKKGDFIIDIDELDFGYKVVEIELMVQKEDQIKDAQEKIMNLAKEYGLETKKLPGKRKEYFRLVKPEIYKKLYGDK